MNLHAPYGLTILDNCLACAVRQERLFCNLSEQALQKLTQIKSTAVYPAAALLFSEGQEPRGIFVLCSGKVKLSASSKRGKTLILKLCEAGEVLGINATISNHPYEVSAEMLEPGQANFIPRDPFLGFLREHGDVALRVAEQLSRDYYATYNQVRTLGLTTSPAEKLAKLLLSWQSSSDPAEGPAQVRMVLTHEEISEMIGTTRETVSRLFSEFKKKRLLEVRGSILVLPDRAALTRMAES